MTATERHYRGQSNEIVSMDDPEIYGDTFELPKDSLLLGSSVITPVQGYLAHGGLLALQFHPEIKPENISLMINHAGDELVSSPYIQDTSDLSAGLTHLPGNKVLLETFLDYLEKQVKPA